jgi:hypothetical protein
MDLKTLWDLANVNSLIPRLELTKIDHSVLAKRRITQGLASTYFANSSCQLSCMSRSTLEDRTAARLSIVISGIQLY